MSSSKAPSLPQAPSFYQDPMFGQTQQDLYGLGTNLTNFNFGGSLSPLQDTINLDPEVTRLALQYAQSSLQPQYEDMLKSIKNEAAGTNSLNSSTFTDALAQLGTRVDQSYQGIVAGAALEDRSRALQNRMSLFGTGLDVLGGVRGAAFGNQGQRNDFNQQNYQNQVMASLYGAKSNGGFWGGLTGALGGGLAGSAFGPVGAVFGGLAGGLAGGYGQPGTGGQLLGAGASLYGSNPFGFTSSRPGATASNNPLTGSMGSNDIMSKYSYMFQ